jgi:hypothetical protein
MGGLSRKRLKTSTEFKVKLWILDAAYTNGAKNPELYFFNAYLPSTLPHEPVSRPG